jgi:putative hydrolase of the HAD superfamily
VGVLLRAVIFDAVGTIIRPFPSVGAVYARAVRDYGLRCPATLLDRHFRRAYRDLKPERFTGGGRFRTSEGRESRWWKRAVSRTFEAAGCGRLPREAAEAAFDAFSRARAWRPYADVAATLDELSSIGLRLGVVSNFDSRLLRVLQELNLTSSFSSLIISSECGYAKPSPRIFQAALKELDVRADEALHVGDRREEDYHGPRAAGLDALWLVRDGSRRGPGTIRSLSQLPRIIRERS